MYVKWGLLTFEFMMPGIFIVCVQLEQSITAMRLSRRALRISLLAAMFISSNNYRSRRATMLNVIVSEVSADASQALLLLTGRKITRRLDLFAAASSSTVQSARLRTLGLLDDCFV
jgi:hypothetical protein